MAFIQPAHLQSYGRRRGRKLHKSRSALMETLLPKLLITLEGDTGISCHPCEGGGLSQDSRLRGNDDFLRSKIWFEIGFGAGEHLLEQARRHPDIHFIGCEPYINGMASLLSTINKEKLANIRLYDGDARLLLERLPDGYIERLFVLFPDPWPKTRHHKRRIISQETLALFHVKQSAGGLLRIATDHEDYGAWMLEHLLTFGKFKWMAGSSKDWKTPPEDWVTTRYQAKAEAEGRKALFLDWVKTG